MAILSFLMAAALMTVGQSAASARSNLAPAGSTKVAVVDVPSVSQRYQRFADLEAHFEQQRVSFGQKRDAIRERIERTTRSLGEQFKPGTNEFEERRKQLAMLEAELQWFVETEGQKIEQSLASSLRSIFHDIHTVVQEVAEEKGIDVVLAADRLPEEPPGSTRQARQQIVLQKVVYWSPRVDLTDEVAARLNAKYKAQGAKPPLGPNDRAKSGGAD